MLYWLAVLHQHAPLCVCVAAGQGEVVCLRNAMVNKVVEAEEALRAATAEYETAGRWVWVGGCLGVWTGGMRVAKTSSLWDSVCGWVGELVSEGYADVAGLLGSALALNPYCRRDLLTL